MEGCCESGTEVSGNERETGDTVCLAEVRGFMGKRFLHVHFYREAKAQRGYIMCPGSHSLFQNLSLRGA